MGSSAVNILSGGACGASNEVVKVTQGCLIKEDALLNVNFRLNNKYLFYSLNLS